MKANELEIGDLVDVRGSFARVSELSDTGFFRARELEYNSTLHLSSDVIDASTNPIPLTEEILKANGFVNYKPEYWAIDFGDCREAGGIYIGLDVEKENEPVRSSFHITSLEPVPCDVFWMGRYVHELQHALHLCGLTDLADNFKLKEATA